MANNKTEQEAREEILALVCDYAKTFHKKSEYKDGDRIPYAGRVFDEKEVVNLVDSSLDFWLTAGRFSKQFEHDLAEFLSVRFCLAVNSGSSANLLAFMALTSPMLKERMVKPGDEVITVAAGFPTTVSPIIQYGAIPVFVDVAVGQYNVDVTQLEKALSDKTKAVMFAHTMGNPFDVAAVKQFCDAHQLWLIEDNCDSLGAKVMIDGKAQFTGTVGDIGTSSFYPPHHMTMGEGGAVYTNDPILNKILLSMRDWGRDCICPPGKDNVCKKRFSQQFGLLPFGYDHKYVYSHFGYNLKITDMQAAIGCEQLKKLPNFIEKRRANFETLKQGLESLSDVMILPQPAINSIPSWFGFLITLKKGLDRNKVVGYIEKNGIQTRLLFAGNLIKHPCFDEMRNENRGYRVVGDLPNTEQIMSNTFWVGLYPGMTELMLNKMIETIKEGVCQ